MKLKKISVESLYGIFDHEIVLNTEAKITIIIGENGLGKTVLLEMVEAFFASNYYYFNKIDFKSISFFFDDNVSWFVKKELDDNKDYILNLTQINKGKKQFEPIILSNFSNKNVDVYIHRITRYNPNLRRVGPSTWEDRRSGERLRTEELLAKYNEYLEEDFMPTSNNVQWYKDRHEKIDISLIETQRLIAIKEKEDKGHGKTVEKYSLELSKIIKAHLTESTELSSKLDRTYPNRLIKRLENSPNITDEYLNSELIKLEKKRELLDAVGLIEIDKESSMLKVDNSQKIVKNVLMLYVEDSFNKIQIFDKKSKKIEVFLDIINRRFKHKQLHIDKEIGFLLKSTVLHSGSKSYSEIPVSKLSSGEQNELVLFYLLLFNTKENSLILIDEPEVSLHISWQNSFIEDLKQIVALNNLDVVIATHSPDIIANNWDLKVELTGVE